MDAVFSHEPSGLPLGLEVVQVGERLAEGEAQLMRVELAPKEHGQQIGHRAGLRDGAEGLAEPLLVMVPEMIEPPMEAAEGQTVGGQDQGLLGERAKARERIEIEPERI